MKREFGTKLFEDFLAYRDLRLVADTSGAHIPGHGTPTVIIIGRNQPPVGSTLRAVLGIRREAKNPDEPAKGKVWTSIIEHVDSPGWDDGWVTVTDLERNLLANHPWSLTGGGAVTLHAAVSRYSRRTLGDRVKRIGFFADSHADEAFFLPPQFVDRLAVSQAHSASAVRGDGVRDWQVGAQEDVLFPYDSRHDLIDLADLGQGAGRYLWRLRTLLGARSTFGGGTYKSDGRRWYEWHQLPKDSSAHKWAITFGFVATHNHFALDRDGKAFNRSAPVIKLSEGATAEELLDAYPRLTKDDIQACLAYAADAIAHEDIYSVSSE